MAVLGAAGGGKSVVQTISFVNSTTWSPAQNMNAKIYVVGGGGSGGAARYVATGGGAGGCAVTIADLDASTTYTITIGAGGLPVVHGPNNGNAGSNTTFSGTGISTMTGSGGQAGLYNTSSAGAKAGGAGGAASGGTYGNFTGGAGGATSGSGANHMVTGGGAVGLWATGTSAPGVAGSAAASTDTAMFFSGGGYTIAVGSGASVGGTFLTRYHTAAGSAGYEDVVRHPVGGLLSLIAGGQGMDSDPQQYNTSYGVMPMGVGGPFGYQTSATMSIINRQAGAFAGGGGVSSGTVAGYWGIAGPAGIGGGGGGVINYANHTNADSKSGQGGVGCVLIEVLEYK